MAPLGSAESTTGNINEDLQHYKKKLNESMPRALFPWLWPVPISNRRGFEMGEISPSLCPLRGLYCSALIDACSQQRWLAALMHPLCQSSHPNGADTSSWDQHWLCHTALPSAGGSYVHCKSKHPPSPVTKMCIGAQKCNQQEIWGRKGGLGDF